LVIPPEMSLLLSLLIPTALVALAKMLPLLMIPPDTSLPMKTEMAAPLKPLAEIVPLFVIETPVIVPDTLTAVVPALLIVPELVSVALLPMILTVGSVVVPAESVKVAWTFPVSFAIRTWFCAVSAPISKSAAITGMESATSAVVPKKNARVP